MGEAETDCGCCEGLANLLPADWGAGGSVVEVGVDVTPLEMERCCCCWVGDRTEGVDEADESRLRIWRVAGELAADECCVEMGGRPRRAGLEAREVCWAGEDGGSGRFCVCLDEGKLISDDYPSIGLCCSRSKER
jgi:hypothetical protein